MAALSQADSKRKYSWWWDSHISPKNSKWLQENLTDMDVKVKQMIKLIEEDADSFARRAEMYYKKRPELMKLVEEFYRAYRALAERYDHATGALRQAHRTMAEAFPNQVPFVLADDSPAGTANEMTDPQTPEMLAPVRAMIDPDELQKDALGLSSSHFHAFKRNGVFTEEPDTVTNRKGLKQLNDLFGSIEAVSHAKLSEGKARKGLNFQDAEEKERSIQNNGSHNIQARVLSESERVGKAEAEISTLKKTLAKLEAEKDAGLLQYQQTLERLSNLESEISRAQEDSKGLSERASEAEAEVQTLKEALAKLESERENSRLQYQQCLDRISNLENNISRAEKDAIELNERASKAEEAIKQDLVRVEAEKEVVLAQYNKCLEIISNLEDKVLHAEENARFINERADKAEIEVETLKQALARLTEENGAAALQYLQSLETICSLEQKISYAQEEAQRLNCEINDGVAKLKGAEESCLLLEKSNHTLQSELESLVQKMGSQSEELTEKQKELGRLWTCIQEERLRFVEAETAFQTLQHLHSQSQEELRSLAAELHNRSRIVKDMETRNQCLENEVQKVKEENKSLNELNLSSVVSIKNLQDEILSLRETIGKLEEEVLLRVDQRNALQQEIYCLKEELNELNKKHWTMLEQVESVGFEPDCFGSSVKELQDENSKLKEIYEAERSEKVALLEKLEIMEKLKEKNAVLENSLSDLNVELEGVRGKVKALEESCQSLFGEKSTLVAEKATLISQLQITTTNLEKLSEENNFLENSLSDANAEFEVLRVKLKTLEDLCQLLDNEKSGLITERESLVSQLDSSEQRLQDLEKRYTVLEHEHSSLENERESTLHKVEELQASLDAAKEEHASFSRLSGTRLACMELQIRVLEEEGQCRKKEYEEELDKSVSAQTEIFILQKCVNDLEDKICSLLIEHSSLENERESTLHKVEELQASLDAAKEEHASFSRLSETRLACMELQIRVLEEEGQCRKKEYEEELDKSVSAQTEIFILQKCVNDLEDKICSLLIEHSSLENERESTLHKVEELQASLDDAKEEHASFSRLSETRLACMELQIRVLEEEGQCRKKEYEEELDKSVSAQTEIFILQKCVNDLEDKICSLLIENSSLENERESTLHKVEELQASLDAAKEEHASFSRLSETRLACMELQIRVLEEEGQCRKKEYEEELDKSVSAQTEIFILQKCVNDLEDKICSLLIERQKLLEASKLSEKLISELEHENLEQQVEVKSLFEQIKKLRMGLYLVLKTLGIDEDWFEDKSNQDEAVLSQILCKLQETQNSLFRSDDENQQLLMEKSVLVTLLGQLKVDGANLVTERNTLAQEFSIRSEQLSMLETEIQKLLEMNGELSLKVMEGDHREKVLTTETDNLCRQLLDLQRANQNLQEENSKVLEEKRSLIKETLDLGEEKHSLEDAHWALFGETMSQCNLSLIFNNIVFEKFVELKELTEDLVKLHCVNYDLEEKVRIVDGKFEGVKMENSDLKESLNKLEHELVSLKSASDQLRCEIATGKDMLCRKESEHSEAEQIISAITNEKTELHKLVEDLKSKYDEAKVILEDQEKQILKLSADNELQSKETGCLQEVNQKLESDLWRLHEELEESKIREESLSSELQKGRDEIELWESQAAIFFAEQQVSTVCEMLFEGKIRELIEACESLEDRSDSKDMEIEMLKERVSTLKGENGGLQAQLAAYTPAVISFKNCISSLEKHTLFHYKPHAVENEEAKDAHLMTHPLAETYQQRDEDQISMVPDGFSDLQDVQRRIKAIEKAVVEAERLAMLEHLNMNAKLETAMREIEEFKSLSRLSRDYVRTSKRVTPRQVEEELGNKHSNDLKLGTQTREISEARNEVLPKDIMLDQMSECSSYGISRRETAEADQMLELWETTNRDGSIDLRVGKSQKVATAQPARNQIEAVKEHKRSYPSTESLFEKELGVDKLEISESLAEPSQEGNKRKVLERLDSDAQKLTNLQITVEDLKRKVGITEKSKKGRGIEFDTVKVQLDEADESIMKLFDVNRKLMKTVESTSLSFDGVSAIESDESGNSRRRKISEQARRGSEKIGRLQLEVQKIQFLLLKLDDDKESRGKTRIIDRKPRVLLRDYLYGGVRTSHKRKKAPFCACVRPPTKGD